jgi:DNA invertase Pin-like site-specific DNA recombinase
MIVGYARVSTREQCFNGQLAELQPAGCAKVYSEKASGARGDRAELRKVTDRLQPGDVLVVTRLDRLARSTRDLLNVLESVKQAGHHDAARAAHAHDPGWPRRVRADADPRPDRRRP